MNRTANLIYISVFAGSLLALSLWSSQNLIGFSSASQTPVLNGKLTQAFEKHYDATFPIKQFGTNVWAALDYSLFGEGRPGVVIGRNDWLYSDEEFKPVANHQQHMQDNWALISGVRDVLAQRNIKLVLAILPAKNRLYPEHLADEHPSPMHHRLYERFHAAAAKAGILAPDLLDGLRKTKQGEGHVFLRTDTHWTPLGAQSVAQQLGRSIGTGLVGANQRYSTQVTAIQPYSGDLLRFIPVDPLFTAMLPPPDQLQKHSTQLAEENSANQDLFGEVQIPVVLVGTSYSANPNWNFDGALRQVLASDLVNHAEDGQGPIRPMLKFLQSSELKNNPPQVVIWEFPERYLPMATDLSEFDLHWISQLKKNDPATAQQWADDFSQHPRMAQTPKSEEPSRPL